MVVSDRKPPTQDKKKTSETLLVTNRENQQIVSNINANQQDQRTAKSFEKQKVVKKAKFYLSIDMDNCS